VTAQKPCCKKIRVPAATSRIALLALLLAWPFSRAAAKDTAPEWLQQLAQQPVPAHDSDAVAVILLDDTEATVRADGQIQTLHRRAFRILRPEARREFGGISVDFDSETKISYIKAWTIDSEGHDIAVSEKDAVEHGYLDELIYVDDRVKSLQFPEANPGSVIGYEYVQQQRPYVFEDEWNFQDTVPIKESRFDLHLPPGWDYTAKWFNHPEVAPETIGNDEREYVWQVGEQPAIREEPDMPPWQTVAGWVGIKYFPRDAAQRAKSVGSWTDIGLWYNNLTQSRRDSTPAIHDEVAKLTAGVSDPLAQIQAIADYVQHQVRYFGIEIGIGGFQPHPASEIFANKYGDCKDKATLLSTMLKEIGVDSYYVAVDAFREGVRPDYPSVYFDHMILAIRVPAGVNTATLYSLVQDPKLGSLLIFDPTNEYVPLGYLPTYLQNTYGLVMAPDGGTLVQLPVLPPATNRLLRTAQLSLSVDGGLSGEVKELRWGAPAHQAREEYLETQPSKRAEVLESFLQEFLPNFVLTNASLGDLDNYDQPLSVDYKFVSQGYARTAGNEILLRPRVFGDKYASLLGLFSQDKPRLYPIEFSSATRQDDVFDITLPPGYELDGSVAPVNASCDFATYSSQVQVENGVLHYKRTLIVTKVHVPTDKLPQVHDFLTKIEADQQMYVGLKFGTGTTATR
jgi:hypothetical protein